MKKVLIADRVHNHLITSLESLGFKTDYRKDIDLELTTQIISDYEGVIINSKTIMNKEMIDRASKLEFIGRLGSGLEIIDLEYAQEKGIQVFNSPEGNRNAVAEHALGMLLAFSNNLMVGNQEVKSFIWNREQNRGFELEGKTIGIVGFGNTGNAFSKVLHGFDVNILAHDKYKDLNFENCRNCKSVSLAQIQLNADVISFHLPYTEETHHLVNQSFIEKCKKGVVLINTSRGKIFKTNDLISNLENGTIAGVCLDVFENEKVMSYNSEEKQMYKKLFNFPNVMCSPHVAGWTKESLYKIADTLFIKIKNMYS